MALAERAELNLETLLTVLGQGAMASPMIALKGPAMAASKFDPAFPLKHQQKDLRLALELGCALYQASTLPTSNVGIPASFARFSAGKARHFRHFFR
jgi:glyoxylate/succinic semialdehyde reductase